LRKNALNSATKAVIYQQSKTIQDNFCSLNNEHNLDKIARDCGFIERKGKVSASAFVNSLLYSVMEQDQTSLMDIKCDLEEHFSCKVSKVALHNRFTPKAVSFLKAILSAQLSRQLDFGDNYFSSGFFKQVCIKDSTKFNLPLSFINDYPGYNSYNKNSSIMNIQYEYDILSGNWKSIELTKATRNDQCDSRETINTIQSGDLYIRDLGYVTTTYLEATVNKGAYFLNRLKKINVYQFIGDGFKILDWDKLHKEMKQSGIQEKELVVYLGKNDKIKTRMVLFPVDNKVAESRIRKASKGGKRKKKYQLSKEYKIKAHYNIFITNVPEQILSTTQIQKIYKLRWQIELIFKAWKSHLKIDKVKPMKKERFECQLLAKFLWTLLNWRIFQLANYLVRQINPDLACSVLKFYQRAKRFSVTIRHLLLTKNGISKWLKKNIKGLSLLMIIEKKSGKMTHSEILRDLCSR